VGRDPDTESTRSEAIRLALRELGYIEGQNIAFEYRYAALLSVSGDRMDSTYPRGLSLIRTENRSWALR
jgi:hypothetical protein